MGPCRLFESWSFIFRELICITKISASIFHLNRIKPYSWIWRRLSNSSLICVRFEPISFRNWRKAWSLFLIRHTSTRWGVISSPPAHIRTSWHLSTLHISHRSRNLSMWVHPWRHILIIWLVRTYGASPRISSLLINLILKSLAHHRLLAKRCGPLLLHVSYILGLLRVVTCNIAVEPKLISVVVSEYLVLLRLVYTGPHHLELPDNFHSFPDIQR